MEGLLQRLARRPLIHALLATPPLWLAFGNIVVALCVAVLAFLFLAMCHSLIVLNRQESPSPTPMPDTTPAGATGDALATAASPPQSRRRKRRPRRRTVLSARTRNHDQP